MSADLSIDGLGAAGASLGPLALKVLLRVGEEAADHAVSEGTRERAARTAMKLELEELEAMGAVVRQLAAKRARSAEVSE